MWETAKAADWTERAAEIKTARLVDFTDRSEDVDCSRDRLGCTNIVGAIVVNTSHTWTEKSLLHVLLHAPKRTGLGAS